jgi:mRNA interferase RelE/StbE
MAHALQITHRAQRALAALPVDVYPRARDAIRQLATEPRPPGCSKLRGREGWPIRVGDYRIIYEIDDQQSMITILHIGHRRDVYR